MSQVALIEAFIGITSQVEQLATPIQFWKVCFDPQFQFWELYLKGVIKNMNQNLGTMCQAFFRG